MNWLERIVVKLFSICFVGLSVGLVAAIFAYQYGFNELAIARLAVVYTILLLGIFAGADEIYRALKGGQL